MPFNFIPNLTASVVSPIEPWNSTFQRPSFATKAEFREWCNHPETNHAFITAVEGRQPALRVSEVNPPARMCGLVLDYDAQPPAQPEVVILSNAPADLRPAYVSRTFSGNCRVLYRFEEPIPVFNFDLAREFLRKCQRELKLRKLLPGFEAEALMDLSKHYEIGEQWTPIGDGSAVIPGSLLMSWIYDAGRRHKWEREGPSIPMEIIREEGEKKFPAKWPGGWDKFDIGARGPRFWDESAGDPTACTVRESGIQYFSDGGGFMTWGALFGQEFIRKWSEDRKGAAIERIWYDGNRYWRKLPSGEWDGVTKSDIGLDLVVDKRLSPKPRPGGQPSEVDCALFDLQTLKKVAAAVPFVYRQDGPCTYNGKRYLNTSSVIPIHPVPDYCDWGDGFPWLAEFLYTLFDPQDQLDYFIAWLKHFYLGAITNSPKRGLALFIAGPPGAGKTVLNKAILGQLMGGRQDAGSYLLGSDKFNDELLGSALWNVDDEVVASDPKQRAVFSQMVKKVVANDSLMRRAMFNSGRDMEWLGRVVVTMNDDPESLQMLPETEINILDKIMLLKTRVPDVQNWPSDAEIAAELPFFGAFLRDWVVPENLIPPPNRRRFGVVPYRHADLIKEAGAISETSTFEDILLQWRQDWFAPGSGAGSVDQNWTGNAVSLLSAMQLNGSIKTIVDRNFSSPTRIGTHLNKLIKRGVPYLAVNGHRRYAISNPNIAAE